MNKVKLLIAAALLAGAAFAAGADAPAWARVYYTSTAAMERDILGAGFDVCSGAAGEYVDVVATKASLAGLQDMGYRVEILADDAFGVINALPPDLGLYHTYEEMLTELKGYAAAYPNICRLDDIGDTWESRDIWRLKISDNPGEDESGEPKLFIVGNHHARELMTVEIPLYFIKSLLEGYSKDADIKYYVDNYDIQVVSMANPDGHVYVENHSGGSSNYWWRKNRRDNGGGVYGVDINRNYGYMWGYDNNGSSPNPSSDLYRGPSAFSEPETTAIRNLMIANDFLFALDYHSYGEDILLPWGYPPAGQSHTPEHAFFMEVGTGMNTQLNNRYAVGTVPEILYRVNGGSIDYHYGEQTEKAKCYGWCFEVNSSGEGGFSPPENLIQPTCEEHWDVLVWLLEYMRNYMTGIELADFEARPRAGAAVVTWTTDREYGLGHAGFNLYRAEEGNAAAAPRVKVNDELMRGTSPYRYVDGGVEFGKAYDYYLEAVDLAGGTTEYGPARLVMGAGVKAAFALGQNAPNPARGVTTIRFAVPAPCDAAVEVYDVAGRKVKTAFAGAAPAGETEITVDVSTLAPGVYTYRLAAGGASASRKMVVVK
jgi:hypothetical protein